MIDRHTLPRTLAHSSTQFEHSSFANQAALAPHTCTTHNHAPRTLVRPTVHNLAPARNSSVYRRQRQSRRRTMIAAWCTLTLPAVAPIAESRTCGHLTRCSSCSSSCTTFGSERLPCKLNTPQEAESQWPCPRGSVHGQQSQASHDRVKRAGHQPPPREHAQRRVHCILRPRKRDRRVRGCSA